MSRTHPRLRIIGRINTCELVSKGLTRKFELEEKRGRPQ
jgi:hypothetical protein